MPSIASHLSPSRLKNIIAAIRDLKLTINQSLQRRFIFIDILHASSELSPSLKRNKTKSQQRSDPYPSSLSPPLSLHSDLSKQQMHLRGYYEVYQIRRLMINTVQTIQENLDIHRKTWKNPSTG